MYEPYVNAIASRLLITLPPWLHSEKKQDNWQVAPWDEAIQARRRGSISSYYDGDDHF